ncbi:MAG: response regulator transcription factor [Burkholderiaceae bacterium]|jgi:DNA-binding NarL/FixJ family response regulator|nr:response regulator transcription factor [Burkholderiaceae bacterium]
MRCLVVDDHPLTRAGTALALRSVDATVEVLEAESLEQALHVLATTPAIDLVLLDLELGDSHGVDTLRVLKEHVEGVDPCPRIVVLSGHCELELVREVINLYATGFIQKATSNVIFQHAISITLAGGVYIPEMVLRQMNAPAAARAPNAETLNAPLTPRENEIAALLVRGLTYKRIARELERRDGRAISDHTVRAHVGNIAWKLGVTENAKAGVMAEIARRGLVFR